MTSESAPPFDFAPIYELLHAFNPSPSLDEKTSDHGAKNLPLPSGTSHHSPKSREPINLGDFGQLFESLGLPVENQRPRHESTGSSSTARSHHSTPPTSIPDEAIHFDEFVDRVKEVHWTDQVEGTDLAERFESEPELSQSRTHSARRLARRRSSLYASADEFIPRSVAKGKASLSALWTPRPKSQNSLWVPSPIPKIQVDPLIIQPIYNLTAEGKREELLRKLKARFEVPSDTLGNKDQDGIHVFVDCSNIIIGFYNALKIRRGYNIRAYIKQAPISWYSLALVLERGRAVARRVLVGSNGSPPDGRPPRLPDYMLEAERCGYELNILERVLKHKDPTPPKKKSRGTGNGYATTSGHSSGSDGTSLSTKVVAEQGVDEILQMKILESLVDAHKPSTIVLASGDAAEAEYSGGFLKNVERALIKGWKVELVAWSTGLSHEYLSREFLRRWKGRFEVVSLDDFSEELLALYAYPIAL